MASFYLRLTVWPRRAVMLPGYHIETISTQRKANDEEQPKYPSILSTTDEHGDHLDDEVKRVEEVELLWKVPGQARQPGGSPRIHLHSGT